MSSTSTEAPKPTKTNWWHTRVPRGDDVEKAGLFSLRDQIPSGRPQPHKNALSRHDCDFLEKLKEDEIYESTQHHESFTFNGNTVKGLDKYNDPNPYNLPQEAEKSLLRKEISRLISAAASKDAYLFDSHGLFNTTSKVAFQELADIADQVKCAMGIIRLDNASISIQHCTNELQDTLFNFRHARSRLMGRFDPDQSRGRGRGPTKLAPPERNTALYHTLVDYMTASLARTLVRTAVSDYWNKHTLSCLAACTVKMKTLGKDLEKAADKSISNAEGTLGDMTELWRAKAEYRVMIRNGPDDEAKEIDPLDMETDTSRLYHEEKTIFNKRVWLMLRHILYDLLRCENRNTAPDCFQAHIATFKAGLDSFPTILSIDRMGQFDAAAEPILLKVSFSSMELMVQNARKIKEARESTQTGSSSSTPGTQTTGTMIECEWSESSAQDKPFKMQMSNCNIDEVISVMVPLSLARPGSSISLFSMLSMANSATEEEDPILQFERPPEGLRGFLTVTTGAWEKNNKSTLRWKDHNVMSLAAERVRYGLRVDTADLTLGEKTEVNLPSWKYEEIMTKTLDDYQRRNPKMKRWIVSDDSITIRCRTYVFTCVVVAFLIVCAGIAIPFVVRDTITGVDPFQITLFTWLLAGFIILVAKGRYVNEWPWHEFIHGHVICRSVKEVCDASSFNDQTILMFLMLNEWRTDLRTRGPHNGMYVRRSINGDSGFAINRSAHISTMMASGYVIVKVLNLFGEHLVCLDIRKRKDSIVLRKPAEYLVHMELDAMQEVEEEDEDVPSAKRRNKGIRGGDKVVRLTRNKIVIDRIIGAYVGGSYFG